MFHFKDLQRRLDCTVGKPGTFVRKGQNRPMTVGVRLGRLENMVIRLTLWITFSLLYSDAAYRWENWGYSQSSAAAG